MPSAAAQPEPQPPPAPPDEPMGAPPGQAGLRPQTPPPADAATADATTRAAGRGGLAIGVAKVSFILFGFAQQLILPWLLDVDGYGALAIVLAGVSVLNNVIVATGIQGVSRAVAGVPDDRAAEAFGRTLKIHGVLAIVASAAFALAAPTIAAFLKAPHVTTPLLVVSAVVLLYGTYAPLVGSLNGQRRFLAQAGLDIAYGAIRLGAIACGAILFVRAGQSGVLGASVGFVAAAAIIVPVALAATGVGRRGSAGPSVREHLAFLLPLAISQIFLNLLMQTDFFLFRRMGGAAAELLGLPPAAADELQGVYRGVQLFAFLPYQLLMSVSFILFPMLARARSQGDGAAVRRYTMTGVRIAMLLTGILCAPIAGLAPHVLRLAFPEKIWTQGGDALRIHALGMGAFAILGIVSAALTSLGRERRAAALTGSTVALVAAGCLVAVPLAPFGPRMLVHSAIATGAALAVAAAIGAAVLRREAGAVVAALVPLRVAAAIAATIAVGAWLPWLGKPVVVAEAALLAIVYLVALVALGELGRADIVTLKQAFGRRLGR